MSRRRVRSVVLQACVRVDRMSPSLANYVAPVWARFPSRPGPKAGHGAAALESPLPVAPRGVHLACTARSQHDCCSKCGTEHELAWLMFLRWPPARLGRYTVPGFRRWEWRTVATRIRGTTGAEFVPGTRRCVAVEADSAELPLVVASGASSYCARYICTGGVCVLSTQARTLTRVTESLGRRRSKFLCSLGSEIWPAIAITVTAACTLIC